MAEKIVIRRRLSVDEALARIGQEDRETFELLAAYDRDKRTEPKDTTSPEQ